MTTRAVRFAALAAAPLLLLACGDDGGSGDTNTTPVPTTSAAAGSTSLTILVGSESIPTIAEATLTVGADGTTGTGFLADPEVAQAAAALLQVPANVTRLTRGEPAGQVCTEIYGGPDVAVVTGWIDGVSVGTRFHRSNGCGIADWETFTPLIGRPRWSLERRIYFRDESKIDVLVGTEFLVELASNATTGYAWVASVQGTAVAVTGDQYVPPAEAIPGRGGWQQFTLTAAEPGTATVTFEYRRSFEPADTPPADTATFTVTVTE